MPAILYWMASLMFGFTLLMCVRFFYDADTILPSISSKTITALIIIVLAAGSLRFFWVPKQHNVFYDEFFHMDIGKTAYRDQKVGLDSFSSLEEKKLRVPKWGSGFYVLQAAWYHLFGFSEKNAFILNRILSLLCIPGAFFLAAAIFQSSPAGLWAALLISVYPLHLKFSSGLSIEIASILYQQISLMSLILYLIKKTRFLFYGALCSTVFYCLIRIDNSIIGMPMMLYLIWQSIKSARCTSEKCTICLLSLLIISPVLYHGTIAVKMEAGYHGLATPVFIVENVLFMIFNTIHPVVYTLFAIIGFGQILKKNPGLFGGLCTGFLVPFLFYAFVHRVNFFFEDFCRFFLLFSLFIILAASKGMEIFSNKKILRQLICTLIVLLSIIIQKQEILSPYKPYFTKELEFIKETTPQLPQDSILLSILPVIHRTLHDQQTSHLRVIAEKDQLSILERSKKPILLYKPLVAHIPNPFHDMLSDKAKTIWKIMPIATRQVDFPVERFEDTLKVMQTNLRNNNMIPTKIVEIGFYALVEK